MNITLYYIFLIFTVIILLILIVFSSKKIKNKVIWTYWHDPDDMPELINVCIKSWGIYNPDYKVVILSKKNYKDYVSIPSDVVNHKNFNDSHQRFSDLIRLYVLADNGGLWIDSSILCNGKIYVNLDKYEFSGYHISTNTTIKEYPVIDSWFFACRKDSNFIKKWRDEFVKIKDFDTVDKYVETRKKMGIDFQHIYSPTYLAIHIAAQKVLQIDKYPISKLDIKIAEQGPYKYLYENGYDSTKSFESLIVKRYTLSKMDRGARDFLDKNPELKNRIISKYNKKIK